jgi:hypothetical protein
MDPIVSGFSRRVEIVTQYSEQTRDVKIDPKTGDFHHPWKHLKHQDITCQFIFFKVINRKLYNLFGSKETQPFL